MEPETKSKVIYRGSLTIEKLKELCLRHLEIKSDSDMYNPSIAIANNKIVISLIKQDDGNWKGYMSKNGVLIESREISPEYALSKLLTHS